MIQFSLITKDDGILTKKFDIINGELIKNDKQCFLESGKIETISIEFKELPKFLDTLKPNQAITHGVTIQAPTKLLSKNLLKKRLEANAITRTKDNFFWPDSGIIMFDYDPPPNTEPLKKQELLFALRRLHPELEKAAMVWRPSASSNLVGVDGHVYSGIRNQRVYIPYRNSDFMDTFITNLVYLAWDNDLGYIFITAAGTALPRCVFDTAVFSPERLDFAAGGVCGTGLKKQKLYSSYESGGEVDFDKLGTPASAYRFNMQVENAKSELSVTITEAREIYKEAQAEKLAAYKEITKVKAKKIVASRLKNKILPNDVLYLNDNTPINVRDILLNPTEFHGKTIRDPLEPEYGQSKAKIFINEEGITINSFAHGGRIFRLILDAEFYNANLANIADEELLDCWLDNVADFEGSGSERELLAKTVSKRTGVSKTTLMKDMKDKERIVSLERNENIEDLSHHQIAERLLAKFPPHTVATEGAVYSYNGANCWKPLGMSAIEIEVAENFDCLPKCSRRSDYIQVAKQLYTIAEEPNFFAVKEPVIATQDACWTLKSNGDIIEGPSDPKHRVRFLLPFDSVSDDTAMPMMDAFNDWALGEYDANQILLAQEIVGAICFGVLTRQWHKAVLFRGSGGNGKSVYMDIISGLIPNAHISNVSPFQFSEPLFVAQLSNKLLNIAAELDKGQKLPAAAFKRVVDSSTLTGKLLYHQPFDFPSTAAHVFSSNYQIRTTDGSHGMRRRWIMLKFDNTIADSQEIPEFGVEIVRKEAPQILNWAKKGVQRLYRNKSFTATQTNRELSHEMFMDTNPVSSFLSDEDIAVCDPLQKRTKALRSGVYSAYKEWYSGSGLNRYDMMTKTRFNDTLTEMGYELFKTNGKFFWRGIALNV